MTVPGGIFAEGQLVFGGRSWWEGRVQLRVCTSAMLFGHRAEEVPTCSAHWYGSSQQV